MNRRLVVGLMGLLIVALVLPAGTAWATIFSGLLTANYQPDDAAGHTLGFVVDNPGGAADGVIGVGDYLISLVRLDTINGNGGVTDPAPFPAGGGKRVYAIYTAKVSAAGTSKNPPVVGFPYPVFTLSPILQSDTMASTYSLKGILTNSNIMPALGAPMAPLADGVWDQSVFAVVETPLLAAGGAGDPWTATGGAMSVINNTINSVNGYFTELIGGIANGSNDFFSSRVSQDFYTLDGSDGSTPDGIITIAEIQANDDGYQILQNRGGFSEFWNVYLGHFLPVSATDFQRDGSPLVVTTQHDIVIKPVSSQSSTPMTNWLTQGEMTMQLNHMPEPAAMVMLFGLAAMIGLGAAWRKRKA